MVTRMVVRQRQLLAPFRQMLRIGIRQRFFELQRFLQNGLRLRVISLIAINIRQQVEAIRAL
jgi:hypothetical protein